MKKFLTPILFLLFIAGSALTAYIDHREIKISQQRADMFLYQYNDVSLENYKLKERLDESRLYNKFTADVERISQEAWAPENNCYDHSKALQKVLKDDGIASSIFITPTRDHAFIAVWVEATTGNFIKPGRYDLGEVRDYDLKAILSNIKN